jgi:hypothetical protein
MKRILNALLVIALCLAELPAFSADDTPSQSASCITSILGGLTQHQLIDDLQRTPDEIYLEMRKRAIAAKAKGEKTFLFPEMAPTLRNFVSDAKRRLAEGLDANRKRVFQDLENEAESLLARNVPYHDSVRFGFRYIRAVDDIFREMHPRMKSRYNEKLAIHQVEPLLDSMPDVFIYQTFEPVDKRFFLKSRAAPVYIVGVDLRGARHGEPMPYADGRNRTPAEFAYHDVVHASTTARQDLKIFANKSKERENLVHQHAEVGRFLDKLLDVIYLRNKDLGDAVQEVLFEIHHERGFSYELANLLPQFETPFWTDVILRKYVGGFHDGSDVNEKLFPLIEQARKELLLNLRSLAETRNLAELSRKKEVLNLQINPQLDYHSGTVSRVNLDAHQKMLVNFNAGQGSLSKVQLPLHDVSLAQFDPIKPSPFTKEIVAHLEELMWAHDHHIPVSIRGYPAYPDVEVKKQIESLYIDGHGEMKVRLEGGAELSINQAHLTSSMPKSSSNLKLDPEVIIKIEKLLNFQVTGMKVPFTLSKPVQRLKGKIKFVTQSPPGTRIVEIETDNGMRLKAPLSQVTLEKSE